MSTYPVIPLRNAMMVPYVITPILVGRPASLEALETSYTSNKEILCVAQKGNAEIEDDPRAADLFRMGTICRIMQIFRMPDGNIRALIEGQKRVIIDKFRRKKGMLQAEVTEFPLSVGTISSETEALFRTFKKTFLDYIELNKSIPEESMIPFQEIRKLDELFYFVLANTDVDIKIKQKVYEIEEFSRALLKIYNILNKEIELLKLERKIDGKVKTKLSKLQKDYYLNEQLKIIHKELGITSEESDDLLEFNELLKNVPLSDEARKKAQEEIRKMSRISTHSQEYTVLFNYLSWLFDIPWNEPEQDDFEMKSAKDVLDRDHYGLEKVKDRILDYLAVLKMTKKSKGQILCFVGPPGVGKTSLGKSIAKSLKREFVRLSLGGVRDEAEIRGHRRTYIGALPGIIMQSMKKAGTMNPLIMMDEIDKMSVDFRGDPSSALLEVLDAEQNNQFRDHYLDFGYDLSNVLFITTANSLSSIPQPLLDRMEVIHIPGYTSLEKFNIATQHLIPKQIEEHNINGNYKLIFQKPAIQNIISSYTREAGVRELERKIATIVRKTVRAYVEKPFKGKRTVSESSLKKYLGVPRFLDSEVHQESKCGIVTGLAWTAFGGETLTIEVIKMKGEGKIKLTGKLGDVMQESAQAAYSYARLHADEYDLPENFYKEYDIHLHIPEGAIPKDGPSAGITIATALISCLSGRKVNHTYAMTGEITLSGDVLPIGGLEEKLIAANRAGIKNVIIPEKNKPLLGEIKPEVLKGINVELVRRIDQVLDLVLIKD